MPNTIIFTILEYLNDFFLIVKFMFVRLQALNLFLVICFRRENDTGNPWAYSNFFFRLKDECKCDYDDYPEIEPDLLTIRHSSMTVIF